MPDRKKVIKGLEQFKADLKPFCGNRADWERFDAGLAMLKEQGEQIKNRYESLEKAREEIKWLRGMLKEQEAVEPKKVKGYNPPIYTLYEYECEECKSPMMSKQPFCMGCGRSVKWNE